MVSREIELCGYDRCVALGKGVFVCVFAFVRVGKFSSEPKVALFVRCFAFVKSVLPIASGLAANLDAFELFSFADFRNIYIEANSVGKSALENFHRHLSYDFLRVCEVGVRVVIQK